MENKIQERITRMLKERPKYTVMAWQQWFQARVYWDIPFWQ
jgi:hypothetical protein